MSEEDEADMEPADPILKYSPSARVVHQEVLRPLANKDFAQCGQYAPLGTTDQKEYDKALRMKNRCKTCFPRR